MGWLDTFSALLSSSSSENEGTRLAVGTIGAFPKEEASKKSVKIYPSQRYLDKNLAPEQSLTVEDISALAKASKQAQEKGVLSPELASYLLPMAIVEGRSGNYGIVTDALGLYPKKATLKRFKDMNLGIGEQGKLKDSDLFFQESPSVALKNGKSDPVIRMIPGRGDPDTMARTMATILGEKASLKGVISTDDAIKRYNGKGRALETADGVTMQADVDIYLEKVKEAKHLLEHPKNKEVLELFYKEMAAQK